MLSTRVNAAEYKAVETAAKAAGKEISEWARGVMLGAAH